MSDTTALLVARDGTMVARVELSSVKGRTYEGKVLEARFPDELWMFLREFGEAVNVQAIPRADGVGERIDQFHLSVVLPGESSRKDIWNLQARDNRDRLWFRLRESDPLLAPSRRS